MPFIIDARNMGGGSIGSAAGGDTSTGTRNNVTLAAPWDESKEYLKGDLATNNGDLYQAQKSVPAGVQISDEDYWALVVAGDKSKETEQLRKDIGSLGDLETESKDNLVDAINEVGRIQPDWAQNDETAKDYIKNRICYKEEIKEEVYSNSSLNVTNAGYQSDITVASLGTDANIIYKIIWDGTEYTCTCNTHYYYGRDWYWYGNANLGAPYNEFGSATDEPFMITDNGGLYTDQVGSHSLVIKSISTVYHTLDPNYLAEVESALSDNSKRILNTAYGDFILKNNKVFVSSQETVEANEINSKYYHPFNFYGYDHSIYVAITPEGTNYFDNIGSLKLKFKQRDQSTLAIMPKLLSGREVTADDLPNDVAVFGRGFLDNEIYLLNPKKPILDSITGVVTADKLQNPDHPTDLVAYEAFQAAVPLVQSMNLTGAQVGQTIKVKAVNEQGMPTAWEAAEMAGGGTDISLGLTSAAVGQTIKVKAIDESGKPTAWGAAEEKKWIEICDVPLMEDFTPVAGFSVTALPDGTPLEGMGLKEICFAGAMQIAAASSYSYGTFFVNDKSLLIGQNFNVTTTGLSWFRGKFELLGDGYASSEWGNNPSSSSNMLGGGININPHFYGANNPNIANAYTDTEIKSIKITAPKATDGTIDNMSKLRLVVFGR